MVNNYSTICTDRLFLALIVEFCNTLFVSYKIYYLNENMVKLTVILGSLVSH